MYMISEEDKKLLDAAKECVRWGGVYKGEIITHRNGRETFNDAMVNLLMIGHTLSPEYQEPVWVEGLRGDLNMWDRYAYMPGFVENPSHVLNTLMNELDFEQRGTTPRLEYYMNDHDVPYAYGTVPKVYHPKPWHPIVLDIRKELELIHDCTLDVCFINVYAHHRHHLGWHADDSPEMDHDRPIISVSLGAERYIWLRENGNRDPNHVQKILLENGSAFSMLPGFQKTHQHRIPKHDRECGPRMSLTFRGYVDPTEEKRS